MRWCKSTLDSYKLTPRIFGPWRALRKFTSVDFQILRAVMGGDEGRPPPEVTEFFRSIGKKYGALGAAKTNAKLTTAQRKRAGKKAAAKLTPEQRKERAKKAAQERWAKAKTQAQKKEPGIDR